MNKLNSLILEGKILENAKEVETYNGVPEVQFTLDYERVENNGRVHNIDFDVVVYGRTGVIQLERLKKDREVRIVGRLNQTKWKNVNGDEFSKIFIVAEHIEVKPVIKK